MKNCKVCGHEIPQARVEVLPETDTCVNHSEVEYYVGFQSYPHKTGSEVIIINPKDKEALRLAQRADVRAR